MSIIDYSVVDDSEPSSVGENLHLIAEPDNMVEAAVDILAVRHQLSREEAAELLTQATDRSRPLAQVAEDVVLLGLPSLPAHFELRPDPRGEPSAIQISPDKEPFVAEEVSDTIATALLARLADTVTVSDVLAAISELATDLVPGCEAAAVTVLRDGAPATVASTDDRARSVEETQFRHGTGPYLRAAQTQRLVHIDDLSSVSGDEAWAQVARESGFAAVLVIPITMNANTVATMSLYAHRIGDWSRRSRAAAQTLGHHAGNALAVVQRLDPHFAAGRE
jgi:GAF domain-containing protein